jgi:hypothetical protein
MSDTAPIGSTVSIDNKNALYRVEATLVDMSKGFGLFREELATIRTEQGNQKSLISNMEIDWRSSLETVNQSVKELALRFDEREKPKTSLWISGAATFGVIVSSLVGVAVFFVDSSIRDATAPLASRLSAIEQLTTDHRELEDRTSRSQASDARSEIDRQELNRRITFLEGAVASSTAQRREEVAALQAGFVESETQFKNLTAMVYYIWNKVFGSAYPIVPRETPIHPDHEK